MNHPTERLWEKGEPLAEEILRFTVGRDPELDLRLVPYDALASFAHATMLAGIGVLPEAELPPLRRELAAVVTEARAGSFAISREEEDGHTALENRLTARLGDTGRRIHTGRSRNDQVIAAVRLFGREAVLRLVDRLLDAVEVLLELAAEHRETALPGYTHSRQAMPSTLGFLFAAHAEGLADDLPWLAAAWGHLNRSPLGSASGYGVPLPLDRQLVSDLLGFDRPQGNTLAVQNDRGKSELLALGTALAPVLDAGRLAADLIGFSSDELGFVRLAPEVTTGSSIMPQKRNPDVLELIRAGAARLRARHAEIGAVYGPLPSGYHRDLQLTKEPFLEGMASAEAILAALVPVLRSLTVDRERCRAAVLRTTAATDEVYLRVARGAPFRTAYREVAADPDGAVTVDPAEAWRERRHLGAPGALDLAPTREAASGARRWSAERWQRTAAAWRLLEEEG